MSHIGSARLTQPSHKRRETEIQLASHARLHLWFRHQVMFLDASLVGSAAAGFLRIGFIHAGGRLPLLELAQETHCVCMLSGKELRFCYKWARTDVKLYQPEKGDERWNCDGGKG